jgi:large subunit ribosomal protein L4
VKVALCCTAKNEETDKIEVNSTMNVYDILKYDTVVVTKSAVATIEEVYA